MAVVDASVIISAILSSDPHHEASKANDPGILFVHTNPNSQNGTVNGRSPFQIDSLP